MAKNHGTNLNALARDMLEYQRVKAELDLIEGAIKDTILQLGRTVVTGNLRATYNKGRKTYDYKATADEKSDLLRYRTAVQDRTKTVTTTTTAWKDVCADLDISPSDIKVKSQGKPSVTFKLEK